jgi:hypothetical protein
MEFNCIDIAAGVLGQGHPGIVVSILLIPVWVCMGWVLRWVWDQKRGS